MNPSGLLVRRKPKTRPGAPLPTSRSTRRSPGSRSPGLGRSPVLPHPGLAATAGRPAAAGHWHITPAGNRSPSYLMTKRIVDLLGAMAILILVSPIFLAVLAILLVTTKGHPFFGQERLGFLGRPFWLWKFRTMVLDAEKLRSLVNNEQEGPVFKNRSDPRITRIGRLLRRTTIDELPQLFNVIKGDMSLIGPRPPLASEVDQYKPIQRKRLAVMPGLTCLWQVSGRSEIGFSRWMQMDLWYVKHQNWLTDLMLLVRTPWAVISRRGAH
jgi:lipopolysaccharide/colanic/teichoic acid biosynthesis glycosyltransferase